MLIAIDAGATYTRIATASSPNSKEFTQKSVLLTKNDYEQDISQIVAEIHKLSNEPVQKIGVAVASVLSQEKNELLLANNIPSWSKKPLKEDLEREFGASVLIENDVAAAALAETQEIEDHKSFLFINWGSGIGGAYARFLNGNWEVLPSELGHQILEVGGRECSCGQKGCLEAYCGGEFIKKYSGKMAKELDQESWGKVEEVFSVGLTNLIAILLPEKIIFSGGVALDNKNHLVGIKERVVGKLKVFPQPSISLSEREGDVGLFGALSLLKS